MADDFNQALELVEERLGNIRSQVPPRRFNLKMPAEVEINKFWYNGETVDRIMVVLRSTGCSHYNSKKGCSMCAHYDGTAETPVSIDEYLSQWDNVIKGKSFKWNKDEPFDINKFPVLCLYNLGSFLNKEEVPLQAARSMFKSISQFTGIRKVIIESRPEYVTEDTLGNIRDVYAGTLEVGMGLESINPEIRELCHHKDMPDLGSFHRAISLLHQNGFKALAYVNQKPPFITEKEAIDDTVKTAVFAYDSGIDAVSIEPTSLQKHSLTDHLYQLGQYRVPWLWSTITAVKEIYSKMQGKTGLDLRLGGYFDEEILSGSQGVAPGNLRNELFPHMTAGNCKVCTPRVIDAIKEFNRTYDPEILYNEMYCNHCMGLWQDSLKIKDSRNIPQRIIDILGAQND